MGARANESVPNHPNVEQYGFQCNQGFLKKFITTNIKKLKVTQRVAESNKQTNEVVLFSSGDGGIGVVIHSERG